MVLDAPAKTKQIDPSNVAWEVESKEFWAVMVSEPQTSASGP